MGSLPSTKAKPRVLWSWERSLTAPHLPLEDWYWGAQSPPICCCCCLSSWFFLSRTQDYLWVGRALATLRLCWFLLRMFLQCQYLPRMSGIHEMAVANPEAPRESTHGWPVHGWGIEGLDSHCHLRVCRPWWCYCGGAVCRLVCLITANAQAHEWF